VHTGAAVEAAGPGAPPRAGPRAPGGRRAGPGSPMRRAAIRLGLGLLALAAVLGALAAAGATYQALAGARDRRAFPAPGQLLDVGGHRLHLQCAGQGGPTVVLETGLGAWSSHWALVQPVVAGATRVCAYDRAGLGWSDPGPAPRGAGRIAGELRALLRQAGAPGPYVLVGHSNGGLYVRLYAATYPEEVAGLVLVDASHEEQNARLRALLTPEQWAVFERLALTRLELPGYPELEWVDVEASFDQVRRATAARPLRPLPLVVLSRGVAPDAAEAPEGFPPEAQAAMEREWQALQAALAGLAPGARRVVAAESGHYVQLQQPELVIAAIREVVAVARRAPPVAVRGLPRTGGGPGGGPPRES
jgi:pimeloyl-ACP methyl ester carboxylesterase